MLTHLSASGYLINFLGGIDFSKKKTRPSKLKKKENKISQGRKKILRNKALLDTPDPLKPLPTG